MLDLRNWRKRARDPACMTAGIRATPYDCRDTFASLLIHEGRPVVYVASQMGHSTASTTLDHYAHVYAEAALSRHVDMALAVEAARRKVPVGFPGSGAGLLAGPRRTPARPAVEPHPASGAYRDRTGDPQLAKLVLSQLS